MSPVNWEEVSVIYWDDLWFSFFTLLMCCIVLINLHILNHPCIPGINPTWSWCVVHHQVISKSATPWTIAHQTCLSLAISQFAQIHVHFTGDTSNPLILCIVLLMCYWIQFASILLRILPSIFIFISDINLRFSFFVWDIFLVLVSWYWWPHRMNLGVFVPLQLFWKSFRKIGINSSLTVWYNSHLKPPVLGLLFVGSF